MKVSRVVVPAALAVAGLTAVAAPAFAHVSVQPEGAAAKGGYAVVDFKVPNERDNASTTKVEVSLPTDHPLASVAPQAIPGWKIDVTKSKLAKPLTVHGEKISEAVSKVTWTADGDGIKPGYFQKFPLSLGQLPENTDKLVFKAIQTYSNNEVVRWIEVPQEGQAEPENPAPVLQLSAASDDHHGSGGASNASDSASDDNASDTQKTAADTKASGGHDTDTTARVLGVAGIVVGAAGVAYGVFAGRRRTTA